MRRLAEGLALSEADRARLLCARGTPHGIEPARIVALAPAERKHWPDAELAPTWPRGAYLCASGAGQDLRGAL